MALIDNSPVEGAAEVRQIKREYVIAQERYQTHLCAVVARYGKDALAKALGDDADEFLACCSEAEKAIADKQAEARAQVEAQG